MNKFQILYVAFRSGLSVGIQVYRGLLQIRDWEHFQSFKIEHIIGTEEHA